MRWRCLLMADTVEKVESLTSLPNFLSAVGDIFRCGR